MSTPINTKGMASIKILRKMVLNCLKEFGSVNKSLSRNKGIAKSKLIKDPKTNTTEK